MIKAILTFFFICTAAYASVTVHCENDFDCKSSSNIKSIHATCLLWRFPSCQEPKYDLEEIKEKGGRKTIENKLIEEAKEKGTEKTISKELLPVSLTFYVEYYYGNEGRHTLLQKVLDITHDKEGYRFILHTNYYDHAKDLPVTKLTQSWTRTTPPKDLFMKIVHNNDAQDGIDIIVNDGILIELPMDE